MNISKTILFITLFILAFTGCNTSRITQLETENTALKKQVDSLSTVALTYKKEMEKAKELAQFSQKNAALSAQIAIEMAEKAADSKK